MGRILKSLDLFSGIGGLTLALTGVVKPLAYCDIEPNAIAVIRDNMATGNLPRAAISTDVRTLNRKWLSENVSGNDSTPDAIVAGYPCTGFSLVGKRDGYQNEQSGLFSEICRIIDENNNIKFCFFENVAQIVHDGMKTYVTELHKKRGFNLIWCVVEAREVGAPQRRKRWFSIAYRGELPPPVAFKAGGYAPFTKQWGKEPNHRTICPGGFISPTNKHGGARKRASLLGNAVVPDCARYAFMHLMSTVAKIGSPLPITDKGKDISQKMPSSWPACGLVRGKKLHEIAHPVPLSLRPPLPIILDGRLYAPPKGHQAKIILKPLRRRTKKDFWATPRASMVTAAQIMTARTSTDLPTQVRNELYTPNAERGCPVSPEFIEWEMGYPRGWTKAAAL